ncbi:hypothetical protein Q5P01_026428 [Channa striata]|uniref:G-protein coupled receptors family 1 profile domain-containing protein n=1 Tax=Channa striata TaxID=64152 RepID=A0AA88IL98_CHASR|nr:hypothetical protein Q5P01_026428 [Channa striata]
MEDQDGAELCFPQLLNASCRKPKISQYDVVFMYLLFILSGFCVVLNLLVIISVSHFRQLHTPTNLIILSLAVSDFLAGLVVTPVEFHRRTTCWFFSDLMCSLYCFAGSFIITISIGTMVLISVDRYVAICDPLHYPTRVTVRRVKLCVYVWWACCLLYNILTYREDLAKPGRFKACTGQCLIFIDYIGVTVDTVLSFVLPITVIIFLYLRVFLTAVSQARAMRSHVAAVTLQHSGTVITKKSELKAARTLGIVVFVFLMCYCPFYCLCLLQNVSINDFVIALTIFLLSINSCLNPVIYALFYPWFRKSIRLIFSLQILQTGSCETNML